MSSEQVSHKVMESSESNFDSEFYQKLFSNPIIKNLPNHLKQFIVDQNYVAYSPIDHSVWRYVLRQNHRFLIDHAHEIYFEGLEKTGLKVEGIPSISEMNEILTKIGWAAVTVDGFIPPAAFMEFQAHRVLVIAADMRQIHHIEYTPSPDIIHEAAGHAPVIADPEYAEYLRRFGAIGVKAMSSKKDYELYEAIRKLSILKETPDADQNEIDEAEKDVLYKQDNLGKPSEMAMLSRLHWWTVEYGLIGTLENPKIYGAGLLSSIGEAASCLSDKVKKIFYDISATDYAFDITTMQPHLFVTPDFKHLIGVLEQFADTMAFRIGGKSGLEKAVKSKNTATATYSSGLQVSGIFSEIIYQGDKPIYLKTSGKSNLSYNNKELDGHGIDFHQDGFGSPVGRLTDSKKTLEDFTESDLKKNNIVINNSIDLRFQSGVTVNGVVKNILCKDDKIIMISFTECTVTYNDRILFEPSWGIYDMAIGENIISVFSGAADKDSYDQPSTVSKMRVIKIKYDDKTKKLHSLYSQLRDYRKNKSDNSFLPLLYSNYMENYNYDWLLGVEFLEILTGENIYPDIRDELKNCLLEKADKEKELSKLINDGVFLAENPNKYKSTWKN
jgi:phenylalanine-4-hydroxylase